MMVSGPVTHRVDDLLAQMTLDEKIGQMTQADRQHLGGESDIADHLLGSVLVGGDSAPEPSTPKAWADLVDGYQTIAQRTRLGIPLLVGVDAVHGHGLVKGATVFPHNIGLGATRDAELARRVGDVTATELVATGVRWTFAPCLAVAKDARWGRTYESFSQDAEIVAAMTSIVTGFQRGPGGAIRVLATAKHWVGDGGTKDGRDRGDTRVAEDELVRVHGAPYVEAIRRGVGSVMVSFSSWNGDKLHGHRHLITDVLKDDLGFGGFVVSDWAGVKELPGDYADQVRAAVNAGIDMVMVPDDYPRFQATLKDQVEAGGVPVTRVDDAVSRILAKKVEAGLFENAFADRSLLDSVGSDAHRAVAREAVRESLVLLRNEDGILPLDKETERIFVAGRNAGDIGRQCGGWTMGWQGGNGPVTRGTTILDGIRAAVSPSTNVAFEVDASGLDGSYNVVVAVVGEAPYAEWKGDRPGGVRLDADDVAMLGRVEDAGVAAVVVVVSGRPVPVPARFSQVKAVVAAWLPGTEAAGVADVLFGDRQFVGRLPRSWPQGSGSEDPEWPAGFGLSYAARHQA
jgi:beta-glucosidase